MKLSEVKKFSPDYHTLEEVADFMGISYITLYRLVKAGKIKAIDITDPGVKKPIYRIRPEDVQAYYDQLQNSTNGAKDLNK